MKKHTMQQTYVVANINGEYTLHFCKSLAQKQLEEEEKYNKSKKELKFWLDKDEDLKYG